MSCERKIPALCLKIGVKNALINGEKAVIGIAPKYEDGKIMVPVSALRAVGIKADSEYISFDDIREINKRSSYTGMLYFDKDADVVDIRADRDPEFIMSIAHKFIFDCPIAKMNTNGYAPATEDERRGFIEVGEFVMSLIKKASPSHPHILSSKAVFEKLAEIYRSEDGSYEYNGLSYLVKRADYEITKFPPLNSEATAFTSPFPISGYDKAGYDEGGRHSFSDNNLHIAKFIAFAHMITGEKKYADYAYCISAEIIKQPHWGPGHFLNAATASCQLSCIYDWLYSSWKKYGHDTGYIKRGLYDKGIYPAYNSLINDSCDHPSEKQGTGWRWKQKRDNWNTVCSGQMILSSLTVLSEDADEYITEEMKSMTIELLGGCISALLQDGLAMKQYIPDGSYVESASYWAFGTSNLARCMASLYTTVGTDLGIHNAIGLDKTCYFALHSESSDYVGWNYHDGFLTPQDTSIYNIFATIGGDNKLYALRRSHTANGKDVTIDDMLFSPRVYEREIPALDAMPLDYHMKGIDAFAVRSGWARGSLYAGIMGGYNPTGGSHDHLDSGAFVYHNLGKMWITDLGFDNYNIPIIDGKSYFANYSLYKRNAEGHNLIALKSLTYGQRNGGRGIMTDAVSWKNASYCIIDNKTVYGEDKVSSAKRGMLLLNRQDLVISDEIVLAEKDTAIFSMHFESDKINAELDSDGRFCTLTHKDGQKIYIRFVKGEGKFKIMNCYDLLLDGTKPVEAEHSRENYSRIVVIMENTDKVDMSVVISAREDAPADVPAMKDWHTLA